MKDNSTTYPPTANGQAYCAYLEIARTVLDSLTTADYYALPIPSTTDSSLAEIVSAFTSWPVHVREQFMESIPVNKRGLFAIFGHRVATLAVRLEDAEQLRLGLIGNIIANYQIPSSRNVDAALAVFYHCALKLGLSTQAFFDDAAQFASPEMADKMRSFGRRTDVTLKQFGWRELRTSDGIRYKFEW